MPDFVNEGTFSVEPTRCRPGRGYDRGNIPDVSYLRTDESSVLNVEVAGQLLQPTSLTLTGSLVEAGACP
jgi:hypothetical protein